MHGPSATKALVPHSSAALMNRMGHVRGTARRPSARKQREQRADEGTRTLDLLHGKDRARTDRRRLSRHFALLSGFLYLRGDTGSQQLTRKANPAANHPPGPQIAQAITAHSSAQDGRRTTSVTYEGRPRLPVPQHQNAPRSRPARLRPASTSSGSPSSPADPGARAC